MILRILWLIASSSIYQLFPGESLSLESGIQQNTQYSLYSSKANYALKRGNSKFNLNLDIQMILSQNETDLELYRGYVTKKLFKYANQDFTFKVGRFEYSNPLPVSLPVYYDIIDGFAIQSGSSNHTLVFTMDFLLKNPREDLRAFRQHEPSFIRSNQNEGSRRLTLASFSNLGFIDISSLFSASSYGVQALHNGDLSRHGLWGNYHDQDSIYHAQLLFSKKQVWSALNKTRYTLLWGASKGVDKKLSSIDVNMNGTLVGVSLLHESGFWNTTVEFFGCLSTNTNYENNNLTNTGYIRLPISMDEVLIDDIYTNNSAQIGGVYYGIAANRLTDYYGFRIMRNYKKLQFTFHSVMLPVAETQPEISPSKTSSLASYSISTIYQANDFDISVKAIENRFLANHETSQLFKVQLQFTII